MNKPVNKWRKMVVRNAVRHWGQIGWETLSEPMREAFIAREIVWLILGQDLEKYRPAQELARLALGGDES